MINSQENGDGKFVVVQDGKRISKAHADKGTAMQEAAKLNSISENTGGGTAGPAKAEVKRNIFG